MRILVQRRSFDHQSVSGELLLDGQHECWTLEPAYCFFAGIDKVGKPLPLPKPRAIPAGTYPLTIRWSARFRRLMPHVDNVPDFAGIEIHWGDFPKDTDGCTLVGSQHGADFISHSVYEFDILFQKLQAAVSVDPQ